MAETTVYDILKNEIYAGDFELVNEKNKIMTSWAYGSLTDAQRDELITSAREKAKPEDSYKPLQDQLTALGERVKSLEARVTALEASTSSGGGSSSSGTTTDEYPEYKQPTGSTDAYQVGDKITYNGKKYKCILANCVWTPSDYPAGWEEVTA